MPNSHVATTYVAEMTYICVTSVSDSTTFTPFQPTTSRFRITGQSETSALNDPKMTLNTTTCHLVHKSLISVSNIHESKTFELQTILRPVH